jgi:hypothetical protein
MIGDHFARDHSGALDGLAKERLGTRCVAVLAQEDIDDHAVFVDRAVQIELLPFAEQEHLVHEPMLADRTPTAPDLRRQVRPEHLNPVEDGPVRDVDATLGQQLDHLPAGERVGQIPRTAVRMMSAGQR